MDEADFDDQAYNPIIEAQAKEVKQFKRYTPWFPLPKYTDKNETHKASRCLLVRLLMKSGANGNFVTESVKHSPLHWLAYYGDHKAIKVYLENNDKVELEDYIKNYTKYDKDIDAYC